MKKISKILIILIIILMLSINSIVSNNVLMAAKTDTTYTIYTKKEAEDKSKEIQAMIEEAEKHKINTADLIKAKSYYDEAAVSAYNPGGGVVYEEQEKEITKAIDDYKASKAKLGIKEDPKKETPKQETSTEKNNDIIIYRSDEMDKLITDFDKAIENLKSQGKDATELINERQYWYNKWADTGYTTVEIKKDEISKTKEMFKDTSVTPRISSIDGKDKGVTGDSDDEDVEDEEDGLGTPSILKILTGALDGIVGILFWIPKMILLVSLYTIQSIIGAILGGEFSIESIIFYQAVKHPIGLISVNFFDKVKENKSKTNNLIQENIATWYIAIRNIAIIILVIVAMYIAIRMMLATTSEKKAQYKEILIYWVQSLALIFVLHYIMVAIIAINDALVKSLYTAGEEVIVAKNNNIMDTLFTKALTSIKLTTSMANTFAYMVLCVVTIMFFISYIKRMMTIAFLITIAPLVTVTYSIDKIGDGKSQALNAWLKEFSYTILIQPFHCITYLALGSIGTQLLTRNDNIADIFIGIYFLSFILQSENIIRGIFGIQANNVGNVIGEVALISTVASKLQGKNKGGIQYTGDSSINRFIGKAERSGGQKRTPIRTTTQNSNGGQNSGGPNRGGQNSGGTNRGGQNSGGTNRGGQNTGSQNRGTNPDNWYDHYTSDDKQREDLNNNPARTAAQDHQLNNLNSNALEKQKRRRITRAATTGYVGLSLGVAAAMAKMAIAVASGDGKAVLAAGFSSKDSITKNMDKAVERASQGDMIDAYKLARKVSPDKDEDYFKELAKGNIPAENPQEEEFVKNLRKHQNIMDKHGKINEKKLDEHTDTLLDNINSGDLDQHNALYRTGRWIGRHKSK